MAPHRVALYGGSFDPVHLAHVETAKRAERVFALDEIVWMPAARPPHKPGRELAPGSMRLAMLFLAAAGSPQWTVSEDELGRDGPSYTFDTVRRLPRILGRRSAELDLHLVLGSDNLPGLPDWYHAADLLDRVQPIVAWRDGDPEEHLRALAGRLPDAHLEKLRRGFLRLPPIELSSTEVRRRLAAGEDCSQLLPELVLGFILEHGLYGVGEADCATGADEPGHRGGDATDAAPRESSDPEERGP